MKFMSMLVACMAFGMTAFAADAATTIKTNFPKPPAQARAALRASVGKPFSAGWVFIDGKYIEPPYKVARFGNVIRINDIQVTGEVVSWNSFIKTQKGVKVTKNTPAGSEDGDVAPEPVAAEPEPELDDADDAWEDSLDDLFDDEPAAKKPAKKSGSSYKPRPKKPAVTVTYSFDGEFEHNEKSKALLQKINNLRTKIDQNLRSGGMYCFSSRYSMVSMDARSAKHVLEHLPELMKQSSSRDDFAQGIHSANIPFSDPLIDDVFKHKYDYLRLKNRYDKEKASSRWK